MPDVHSDEVRSRNMAAVRSRNTGPEVKLRRAVWRRGLRFFTPHGWKRLSGSRIPGSPDMIFPSARVAVFVDGCFWHGCPLHYTEPDDNREFWQAKLQKNLERDREVNGQLAAEGWRVLRFWEHELRREGLQAVAARIEGEVAEERRGLPASGGRPMPYYGLQLKRSYRRPGARYGVRQWPFFPPGAHRALLDWFGQHRRPFPWRQPGVAPWAKLVAEMLLRQTAAGKVAEVWPAVVGRYPTPAALAGAEPSEVEAVLRPLGLSAQRTQAIMEAARHLLLHHGGAVPATEQELLAIPHVGPYTAYAVQTFAFGIPAPLVDVNILRFYDRFFGLGTSTLNPHREEHIWRQARRVVPLERVGEFHLALLDLAALVCKAGRPECGVCPVRGNCLLAGAEK